MNTRVWLLLLSLGINGWLLATRPPARAPAQMSVQAAAEASGAKSSEAANSKRVRSAQTTNAPAHVAAASTASAFHWSAVESADHAEYIARLRSIGCPERLIRALIITEVEKLFRPRRAALIPKQNPDKYWERTDAWDSRRMTKDQRAQLHALGEEQANLLRSLLGDDYEFQQAEATGERFDSPEWDFLAMVTSEQRAKYTAVTRKFGLMEEEIHIRARGVWFEEDERDLHKLRQAQRQELAAFLSSEQIEAMELRTSNVANQLRHTLTAFNPTEEEFRALHGYKTVLEQLEHAESELSDAPTPGAQEKIEAQREEAKAALAKVLPPERMKDFELHEDHATQTLIEWGLGMPDVRKVALLREQSEKSVGDLRANKAISKEERSEALRAIRNATEAELGTLLDERHLKAYLRSGGYWIRNLSPTPRPAPQPESP